MFNKKLKARVAELEADLKYATADSMRLERRILELEIKNNELMKYLNLEVKRVQAHIELVEVEK